MNVTDKMVEAAFNASRIGSRECVRKALTAALSTLPAQEPVAWMRPVTITRMDGAEKALWLANETDHDAFPVYDAPLSALSIDRGEDSTPTPSAPTPSDHVTMLLQSKAETIRKEYQLAYGKPCDCGTTEGALHYGRAQGLEIAADIIAAASEGSKP